MEHGIEGAIAHICQHWKKVQSLKDIASLHKVDSGNLARSFRERTGMTVKSFLDKKRKEYVLAEIRRDGKFGYEIGGELGFNGDKSFYRWVKRAFGVTIRELQKPGPAKK